MFFIHFRPLYSYEEIKIGVFEILRGVGEERSTDWIEWKHRTYMTETTYRIKRKGYEKIIFLEGSQYIGWPRAVLFAAQKGGVLQSASEALAFRIEAQKKDNADKSQATRTVVAHFCEGGKWYAAFDDSADREQNIILARVQEGYDLYASKGSWSLSKNDKQVKGLLDRAEKKGRIRELSKGSLEFSLEQINGISDFGTALTPILQDIAEPYAVFLKSRGYSSGFMYGLTPMSLERLMLGDKVEIRAVGLGWSIY